MSLKHFAISGVKWSSFSLFSRQGVEFVTYAILARLLSPSDFGLVGMAMIFIGFINLFKDLGTSAAIIQRKVISDDFLSSILWINVSFGFLGMVLLILMAPLIAKFFNEPRMISILQVLSLTFFISSFGILQQAILERKLAFQKIAKIEFSANISSAIIGIGAALLGAGVWSLVYQLLTVMTVTTLLLWIFGLWRPTMLFKWSQVKSVINYSSNLTGFNIFNYFARNADYFLIGKFLGAQELGYYTLAYRLMLYPIKSISATVSKVVFPIYSRLQDKNIKFQHAYLNVAGAIALVTFPMMFGLLVLSDPFILAVFGLQWKPVVLLVMILAPVGMVQSISTTVGSIYTAKGRTDWMLWWGVASGLLVIIAFIIGLQWGILGVATAYAIITAILTYPNFAIPFRLIKLRVSDLIFVLWRPFLGGILMSIIIILLKISLPIGLTNELLLGILIPTGCIVYIVISWFINRFQMQEVISIVWSRPVPQKRET